MRIGGQAKEIIMKKLNITETPTMTTILDTQLFIELRQKPEWETLWTTDASGHYSEPKTGWLPTLLGGLDHISVTKKYVTFHDIGMNGRSRSFRIGLEPSDRKVLVRAFDQWSDPAGECWAIAGSVDEGIAEVIDQLNEWQDDDAERTAYLRENGTYSVLVNGDWDGYTSIGWDYVDELPAHLEHLPAEAIEREIANARWEDARADAAWLGHTF
jgi:hypothetical protein